MNNTKRSVPLRNSRLVIVAFDTFVSMVASLMAILFVRATYATTVGLQQFVWMWNLFGGIFTLAGIFLVGTHRIVIQHASYKSITKIVLLTIIKELLLGATLFWHMIRVSSPEFGYAVLMFDALLTLTLLVLGRVVIITLHDSLQSNYGADAAKMRVMVYGVSNKSVAMLKRFETSTHYDVIGLLTSNRSLDKQVINDHKVYSFDDPASIEELRQRLGFECVFFATDKDVDDERDNLMRSCAQLGIHMMISPNVDEIAPSGQPHTFDLQTVRSDEFIPDGMNGFARNVKRIVDFCVSALLIVIFSPLFLACYIAVKREDGGPALFRQERIGRFGRPFTIYKFRSMRLDAEKYTGPALYSGNDDPRLTKTGKFLRQHHLDELPQLFNVFKGDMAFVGPRPERQFFIDKIMMIDPRYSCLFQIRPGVTSYATLYNGYTDTIEKMLKRLELDLYYLRRRSWWFDCKILGMTFMSIVFGKKF